MSQEQTHDPVAGYAVTIPGKLAGYRLTIPGRLPGLNEYTEANRINGQAGARMKRQSQELIMWHILAQLHKKHIEKPVFLLFTFYEQDRRRDRDNVSSFARKVIQDALVKAGTPTDDGWDQVTGYLDRFVVDKENPPHCGGIYRAGGNEEMQETTRQELQEVKAIVRKVLAEHPITRGDDNALYYKVCKEHAAQIGVDISTLHFSAVFLGNPLGFPRFESVVRLRRFVQKENPDLRASKGVQDGRAKQVADFVEYNRQEREALR